MNSITRAPKTLVGEERGFVLVVALLLVVALSLIGIAALRNVSLQEKMAGNSYFRMLSFQDAESAMMESNRLLGLASVSSSPPRAVSDTDPKTRPVNLQAGLVKTWLSSSAWSSTTASSALNKANVGVVSNWVREDLEAQPIDGCDNAQATSSSNCQLRIYRTTARGLIDMTGATVITQNFFAVQDDQTIETAVTSGAPSK